MKYSFLPSNFLTVFEISRIELNTQASTGDIDEVHSKFLMMMFYIVRILIKEILFNIERILPKSTEQSRK